MYACGSLNSHEPHVKVQGYHKRYVSSSMPYNNYSHDNPALSHVAHVNSTIRIVNMVRPF